MVGYRLLRLLAPRDDPNNVEPAYINTNKMEVLLGEDVWDELRGKTVLDFGCGTGTQAVEIAAHGAEHVYGIDIQEKRLEAGRRRAQGRGLADRVTFATECTEPVDAIISIDAFEHFEDLLATLGTMYGMLNPGGTVYASFGPTWFHPYGGHLFSVFPFAHLVFSERALIRWRSEFKDDGATCFREVEGGLNQLTIRRFEEIVAQSQFECEEMVLTPIRGLRTISNRWTREFTTAVVRAKLVRTVDVRS